MTTESRRDLMDKLLEQGFKAYMSRPEVKMLVSIVPALQPPELLQTLLKSAFDSGTLFGQGIVVAEMIKTAMNQEKKE